MGNTKKIKKVCRRTNAEILQGRQRQRREDSKLSSSLLHFLGNTRDQQHVFNTPQQEEATDTTNQSNWTHVKTRDKGYKPRPLQKDVTEVQSMLQYVTDLIILMLAILTHG
jgi:hypothetical protein